MARATFVKKARKDIPSAGIKAGESYYWWKFRYGGKHYSKTPPRPSQLTQSEFYSRVYGLQEQLADATADDGLPDLRDEIAGELRDIAEDCTSKRDNMPEALQDSETGSLLQERAEAMEAAADELEAIDFDDAPDDPEDEAAEDRAGAAREVEEYWQGKLEEMQAISIEAP